ncbi:MAG: diacylglycerol kinase [Crocinitomicaceae bacterium]|nr:diacylglycerol kinase [Crocinitomicaceae bacterium]
MKKKFHPALRGLYLAVWKEKSTRLQFIFLFLGILFGLWIRFTSLDWILFFSASVLVIGFEILNSAIEAICDLVEPNQNEQVRFIKDISAGAVLLSAIYAGGIGLYLLWKYIL